MRNFKGYNINAAIEVRVEGVMDDQTGKKEKVDFRTSINMVMDDEFMWGWSYPGEPFILAANARHFGTQIDKKTWKRWHSEYRKYLRQSVNLSHEDVC